jgi:signal transduction histidine kinase
MAIWKFFSDRDLNVWTARFHDSDTENEYRQSALKEQRVALSICVGVILFATILIIHGYLTRPSGPPEELGQILIARGIGFGIACLCVLAIYRNAAPRVLDYLFACLIATSVLQTAFFVESADPDSIAWTARNLTLIPLIYLVVRIPFHLVFMLLATQTCLSAWQLFWFFNLSPLERRSVLVTVVLLGMLGIIGCWQREIYQRRNFALNASLRSTMTLLDDARNEAERLSATKSEFIANTSHELRTPLNAVIGFSEALKTLYAGPLTDKQSEYISDIHDSGNYLMELINDLLDLSKIESGKLELNKVKFDIGEQVDRCKRLVKEPVMRARVSLNIDIAKDLPVLSADERMFRQMVMNLLSNAIKFTPEKGRVDVTGGLDKNNCLFVQVSDNGIGMSREDIPRALSPYEQTAAGLRHTGTGLGLPLVKRMVELHDGELSIESEPDVGTKMTITFPQERLQAT